MKITGGHPRAKKANSSPEGGGDAFAASMSVQFLTAVPERSVWTGCGGGTSTAGSGS
ncbi:MAG: hypothetical protein IZT59_01680 [Verrucomicrobia bacterium]|nr:hypothetical protein [Verrucomicrobiota bacterium]